MGFIMDGLDSEAYDRTYPDGELLRRVVDYFRPEGRQMLAVAGAVALGSVVEAAVPVIISRGLDALAGQQSVVLIVLLALGVALTGCLGWAFNFVRQRLSAKAVGNVVLRLREDAFTAVTERDLSFFDEFSSGRIVSRVTSDTQDFSQVVTLTIDLASQILQVLVISVVLFTIDVRLALITIAVAPLVVVVALSFRRIARKVTQQARRAQAEVNSTVQQAVSGIGVTKSFRQEGALYSSFRRTNQQVFRLTLQQGLVFDAIFPILGALNGLAGAAVVYFGGLWAIGGLLSPGSWYLFVQGLNVFFFPLTSIASFWSQFQLGLAAAERVFALLDAPPRVVQRASEPVPSLSGRVEFREVSFQYVDDQPVLDRFSLAIAAGEALAIVGHTGAGKSSLARLIARFYEYQGGEILVDGRDIRTLDLSQYRRLLGVVPQMPFLFYGTIRDNIRYGRPEASDADVERAAAQIAGGEWVSLLPQGLDTQVGERGNRVSLGQRQLVALARMVLQNPAIAILDEATASVDPMTESQIQDGLDVVMSGRTSLVIAHRLSTVRRADRIIVIERGRIVEEGTHLGLLAKGGHYADLYNTYFRHQSLEYIEGAPEILGAGSG
jgi:ATP-binding cassette, subfamily B, bacterial